MGTTNEQAAKKRHDIDELAGLLEKLRPWQASAGVEDALWGWLSRWHPEWNIRDVGAVVTALHELGRRHPAVAGSDQMAAITAGWFRRFHERGALPVPDDMSAIRRCLTDRPCPTERPRDAPLLPERTRRRYFRAHTRPTLAWLDKHVQPGL